MVLLPLSKHRSDLELRPVGISDHIDFVLGDEVDTLAKEVYFFAEGFFEALVQFLCIESSGDSGRRGCGQGEGAGYVGGSGIPTITFGVGAPFVEDVYLVPCGDDTELQAGDGGIFQPRRIFLGFFLFLGGTAESLSFAFHPHYPVVFLFL